MAISTGLGLGGLLGASGAQNAYITNNTSGQYQDPRMWDQQRSYNEEMMRREQQRMMEEKYREEIRRYGHPVPEEAPKAKPVKAVPASSFPEGYERNLLLLLEH